MRRVIILALAAVAVAGGAYLFIFKKKELGQMYDAASGYPDAKTPTEATDLFRKAIKDRNYKAAAKYCTAPFAEQLTRGAEAASELGSKVDDLVSRMKNDGVMTDEMRIVLYYYDPFWKDFSATLSNVGESQATAVFKLEGLALTGQQQRPFENWSVEPRAMRGLTANWPIPPAVFTVPVKKDGEVWKIDFPVNTASQAAVTYLNDHYKDYVNPFKILSQEIKNDPTTKENVKSRMKQLLEEASRN